MSRNKPTGSEGKGESVAERAVRAYLAGFIHGTRSIGHCFETATGGVLATVYVHVPPKAVSTMLRREKAQKKSSIGDQKRAGKKKTKGAKR